MIASFYDGIDRVIATTLIVPLLIFQAPSGTSVSGPNASPTPSAASSNKTSAEDDKHSAECNTTADSVQGGERIIKERLSSRLRGRFQRAID